MRAPSHFSRVTFPELYTVPAKILTLRSPGANPRTCFDDKSLRFNESVVGFVRWIDLRNVRNKSLIKVARYEDEKVRKDLPKREALETFSKTFSIEYILAVMNSPLARDFLRGNRRSNIHLYPDDWKQLPIPHATPAEQAPIIVLVEQVLAAKAAGEPTASLEAEIDALVAARYSLTPAEAARLSA